MSDPLCSPGEIPPGSPTARKGRTMSIQYLVCCHVKNPATTHLLTPDGWFQQREIDFAVCKKCGNNILRKRYIQHTGEYFEPPAKYGRDKVEREYKKLLEDENLDYNKEYQDSLKANGGLMRNVHYAERNGIECQSNGIRCGHKYDGESWLSKVGGRYKKV